MYMNWSDGSTAVRSVSVPALMTVVRSRRASMMMLAVIVIVPMKMASVTTYGFDEYGIDHDGVPDDVDDDVIDDGMDGEGELRYEMLLARNRYKLEYAGAKMGRAT
jgi:hypothetical protein